MKKIFLMFCILGFTQNITCQKTDSLDPKEEITQEQEINHTKNISENPGYIKKTFSKLKELVSKAPEKIDSFLDTILTKKGALKTLLIVGIPVTIYCYYFPPEILDQILMKISSAAAKGASYVASGTTKGLLVGIGQGIKENKEELKNIFEKNKDEIKSLINGLTYETELIKQEAFLNAQAAMITTPGSSWYNAGITLLNLSAKVLGIIIPITLNSGISEYFKQKYFVIPTAPNTPTT